jgi:hypothetical protein
MKHLLIALAFAIAVPITAQDDGYVMFQTITLTAKDGKGQELNAGLKAHNAKYHQDGAESVNVWAVRSGPRTGKLLWVKGPRTWTDMDTPLEGDGHMDDWRANVTPNAHMGDWGFWRQLNGMSHMPEGFTPGIAVIRYFNIKNQKGDNARRHWNSIIQLYEDNEWDMGLQIYSNQTPSGDGREWMIIWFHENWASMDKNRGFFDQFDEKYGIDRSEFFEEWNEAADFKGLEMMELMKDLSVMGSDE